MPYRQSAQLCGALRSTDKHRLCVCHQKILVAMFHNCLELYNTLGGHHSIYDNACNSVAHFSSHHQDSVSERLRRWTRNPLGSARRGSNPLAVDFRRIPISRISLEPQNLNAVGNNLKTYPFSSVPILFRSQISEKSNQINAIDNNYRLEKSMDYISSLS